MKKVMCHLVACLAVVFMIGCGSSDSGDVLLVAPDTPIDELEFSTLSSDWAATSWGVTEAGSDYWVREVESEDGYGDYVEYEHMEYSLATDTEGFAILVETETDYVRNSSGDWVIEDTETQIFRLADNGWIYSYSDGEWKANRPATLALGTSWIDTWEEEWEWNGGIEKEGEEGEDVFTPVSLNATSPDGTQGCIQLRVNYSGSWWYTNSDHPEYNDSESWSGTATVYLKPGVGYIYFSVTEVGYSEIATIVDEPDWYAGK